MGWANIWIEKLKNGETVSFRPRGNSMSPLIKSGQLVTIQPLSEIEVGDIVLCKVNGCEYLHLIKAIQGDRAQIGNNKGKINGWTNINKIYGKCIKIDR